MKVRRLCPLCQIELVESSKKNIEYECPECSYKILQLEWRRNK